MFSWCCNRWNSLFTVLRGGQWCLWEHAISITVELWPQLETENIRYWIVCPFIKIRPKNLITVFQKWLPSYIIGTIQFLHYEKSAMFRLNSYCVLGPEERKLRQTNIDTPRSSKYRRWDKPEAQSCTSRAEVELRRGSVNPQVSAGNNEDRDQS